MGDVTSFAVKVKSEKEKRKLKIKKRVEIVLSRKVKGKMGRVKGGGSKKVESDKILVIPFSFFFFF